MPIVEIIVPPLPGAVADGYACTAAELKRAIDYLLMRAVKFPPDRLFDWDKALVIESEYQPVQDANIGIRK